MRWQGCSIVLSIEKITCRENTMLFAIHALDRDGALPKRLENQTAHREYLSGASNHGIKIVISGPLTKDDGETMIGSLFLIEAESKEVAERFNSNDPFNKTGVWEHVTITGFIKRQDNR
jgi:uncharacterized protein